MDWTNLLGLFMIATIGLLGLFLYSFKEVFSANRLLLISQFVFATGSIGFAMLLKNVVGKLNY